MQNGCIAQCIFAKLLRSRRYTIHIFYYVVNLAFVKDYGINSPLSGYFSVHCFLCVNIHYSGYQPGRSVRKFFMGNTILRH